MSDIKGFPLLSPEVREKLTDPNKQFLNSVRQAAASVEEGENRKLSNKTHKATVRKQSGTGIISVNITPTSDKGQNLSVSARYGENDEQALDFSRQTISASESIAALDRDGNYDIGSFVYNYSKSRAGYDKNLQRIAVISDRDDNGKADHMHVTSKDELEALYSDNVVVVKNYTSQEIYDSDGDGLLDKFGDVYTYDSRGRPVFLKSGEATQNKQPADAMTLLDALRSTSGNSEVSYQNTGTPSKELMEAFIRNGGPISWKGK